MKTKPTMNAMKFLIAIFAIYILFLIPFPVHATESERVTVDKFVRAESDTMIRANMKAFGKEILDGTWTFPSIEPVK